MADLHFELVTPEKLVRSDDVHMVVVPGVEGEFGVMAGHAPFMTTLKDGELKIYRTAGANFDTIRVSGGVAEVGDRGLTVAKALMLIQYNALAVDRSTVVVVDEASMLGTRELKKLLSCASLGRAKMVLVGDAYQLSPVKARGGMFEQLCADLPWSQRLGEVWRRADPEERDTSLAL